MVSVIIFVGLTASLCEVTLGASMQRCRPCQVVPAQPRIVPCAKGYQRTLEDIISRLVNALIYTSIQNSGAGSGGMGGGGGNSGTGGSGTGGSDSSLLDALLALNLGLGGKDLLDLEVLPGISQSGAGGGTSGGTSASGTGGSRTGGSGTGGSGTGGSTGSSGTGGSGTAGSGSSLSDALIALKLALGDTNLLDLEVLPEIIQSGTGGGTSGGSGSGSATGSKSSSGSSLLQALLDLQVALGGIDVVDLGVLGGSAQ